MLPRKRVIIWKKIQKIYQCPFIWRKKVICIQIKRHIFVDMSTGVCLSFQTSVNLLAIELLCRNPRICTHIVCVFVGNPEHNDRLFWPFDRCLVWIMLYLIFFIKFIAFALKYQSHKPNWLIEMLQNLKKRFWVICIQSCQVKPPFRLCLLYKYTSKSCEVMLMELINVYLIN